MQYVGHVQIVRHRDSFRKKGLLLMIDKGRPERSESATECRLITWHNRFRKPAEKTGLKLLQMRILEIFARWQVNVGRTRRKSG